MFEFETSMSRPTAYELHRRARREQSEAVNAFARSVARKLAQWVGTLAGSGINLTALWRPSGGCAATSARCDSSEILRSAIWA